MKPLSHRSGSFERLSLGAKIKMSNYTTSAASIQQNLLATFVALHNRQCQSALGRCKASFYLADSKPHVSFVRRFYELSALSPQAVRPHSPSISNAGLQSAFGRCKFNFYLVDSKPHVSFVRRFSRHQLSAFILQISCFRPFLEDAIWQLPNLPIT